MSKVQVIAIAGLLVLIHGCVAWTTDSQGKINSVGLPGLPVWKSDEQPKPQTPVVKDLGSAELAHDDAVSSKWLARLNKYRIDAKLRPVSANLDLSTGSRAHADYLLRNAPQDSAQFNQYTSRVGGEAHHEDPDNQFFSTEGAEASQGGKAVAGVLRSADVTFAGPNSEADIDGWISVPFHRMSLLAPWAEVAGYGSAGKYPTRVAAIALRGRSRRQTDVVEFPPSGGNAMDGLLPPEWPDPLTACAGYSRPAGFPISLALGHTSTIALSQYALTDQTASKALAVCAFDSESYFNPDIAAQNTGRQVLQASGMVVLIPKEPLISGHQYSVSIEANSPTFEWSFAVAQPTPSQ